MNRPPLIVAHRGASSDAPENTLAAFRLAWEQGADAIEADFWLTADGHVIAVHDDTFARTTGDDRPVVALSLAEVATLDAGKWKDPRFAGESVPTFAEVLETVPDGKLCYAEVKGGPDVVAAMAVIVATQKHVDARRQLRIISFNADNIAVAKRAMPDVPAYWLTDFRSENDSARPTLDEIRATLDRVNADGLAARADPAVVDAAFVQAIGPDRLHVWTIDDESLALRMADLGVASITTNRPAAIRAALAPTAS